MPKKTQYAWPQMGRPPGPKPGFRLFLISGRKRGETFCFQRLVKALSAQIQRIEDAPLAAYKDRLQENLALRLKLSWVIGVEFAIATQDTA
jgi:hypothetical protein